MAGCLQRRFSERRHALYLPLLLQITAVRSLEDEVAGIQRLRSPCDTAGPSMRARSISRGTSLHAQGTESAEVQAVRQAGPAARGSTAYLNLETGDCHGDATSVGALVQSGVGRC